MIHSMTGFASVQKQMGAYLCCWELKSVNHRYLDVSVQLPSAFRFLEGKLRGLLRDKLTRGKVECQLQWVFAQSETANIVLHDGLVNALLQAGQAIESKYLLANDLTVSRLLQYPGVIVHHDAVEMQAGEEDVLALFTVALTNLIAMRNNEGDMLKAAIQMRLQSLVDEIATARTIATETSVDVRDKLDSRLAALNFSVADLRIEQEIALLLIKRDISEELDRLQGHCIEVARVLNLDEASGRRLDFLMQELNREANTIASKSDSLLLTQSAVQMKILIGEMREQVQNVE